MEDGRLQVFSPAGRLVPKYSADLITAHTRPASPMEAHMGGFSVSEFGRPLANREFSSP